MAIKTGLLKDQKGNRIYPQTSANVVYTQVGTQTLNVQDLLNEHTEKIKSLEDATSLNKGTFSSLDELLLAYPNNIENPIERAGFTAIVEFDYEKDQWYIWDIGDNEWVASGSPIIISGVESVNNIQPIKGNVSLNGSNIPVSINGSQLENATQHIQYLYNENVETKSVTETIETTLGNKINKTDYASQTNAGVIKVQNGTNGLKVSDDGILYPLNSTYQEYNSAGNTYTISKGTLENVINNKLVEKNDSAYKFLKEEYPKAINLLNIQDVPTTTINGVTYSISNGVMTLNGTSTVEFNIEFPLENQIVLNGDYVLSAFNDITYTNGLFLSTKSGVNYTVLMASLNSYVNINNSNTTTTLLSTLIPAGTTFNNNTIKPMLVKGNDTPIDFYKYNQSKHISNNEAKFLKDEYNKSSNVLKLIDMDEITVYGVTYGVKDGIITLTGTPTADFNLTLPIETSSLKTNTNYTIKSYSYNDVWQIFTLNNYTDVQVGWGSNETTFNSGDRTSIIGFRLWAQTIHTFNNTKIKIMMVEGNKEPDTFTEYNGKIVHEKDLSSIKNEYIKNASVSDNTLTLTKQDNTTISFTPSVGGSGGGSTFTKIWEGNGYYTSPFILSETGRTVMNRYNAFLLIDAKGNTLVGYRMPDEDISGVSYPYVNFSGIIRLDGEQYTINVKYYGNDSQNFYPSDMYLTKHTTISGYHTTYSTTQQINSSLPRKKYLYGIKF